LVSEFKRAVELSVVNVSSIIENVTANASVSSLLSQLAGMNMAFYFLITLFKKTSN
jgi:hypothetical protein